MQSIEESLLQAIKNDDTKAFAALMDKTQCGGYRFGRFPVLSLMYLYKSRKLLSAYEAQFLEITNYKVVDEPIEISKKFTAKAGKCLRLYLNEVVSPLEMLLILDRTAHLKRAYPMTKVTSTAVKGRLKSIYYIKYSLGVKFEGDSVVIDRRPLSYREKKNIMNICLCVLLAVVLFIGVPVTAVSLMPKPVEGEVTKLSHINFGSTKTYTLKQDIDIPKNYKVDKVNCTINGDGYKLTVGKGASLGELNGSISDMTIETQGDVIFKSISEKAKFQNVTLNVNADLSAKESTAFVALTNYGAIENVTLNVSGKLNALASSDEVDSELTFGGIVQNNSAKYVGQIIYNGIVKNCQVNYTQFELVGEANANAGFGGVAGINNGYLQNCTVTGEITSDTFDIAGVCSVNSGLLSKNVNEANLSQTSSDTGWNPIVSGIVMSNAYAVEKCENKGRLSSTSTCGQFDVEQANEPTAVAVGIAYLNRGSRVTPYIKDSVNSGDVDCSAQYRKAYAAGVCLSSSGKIDGCKNMAAVNVKADNGNTIYAGGITALAFGDVSKCVNEGAIVVSGSGEAYVGGITAQALAEISYCLSSGDITVTAQSAYVGGITGISEVDNYSIYIYLGEVDYCISQSKISVNATGDTPARVGGIVGYVREEGFDNGDETQYFGGCVTNSYFVGEFLSDLSYFGNVVGVSGEKTYEKNVLTSTDGTEIFNFYNNYYADNSLKSFGAVVTADGEFILVDGKGATAAALEEILAMEGYKEILKALNL